MEIKKKKTITNVKLFISHFILHAMFKSGIDIGIHFNRTAKSQKNNLSKLLNKNLP